MSFSQRLRWKHIGEIMIIGDYTLKSLYNTLQHCSRLTSSRLHTFVQYFVAFWLILLTYLYIRSFGALLTNLWIPWPVLWKYRIFLTHWGRIQRETWCMGPYAGADYNLTLCLLQSRLQHIQHGQPYAKVDLNPVPESTLSPSQGLWIWPLVYIRELWKISRLVSLKSIVLFASTYLHNVTRLFIWNFLNLVNKHFPSAYYW